MFARVLVILSPTLLRLSRSPSPPAVYDLWRSVYKSSQLGAQRLRIEGSSEPSRCHGRAATDSGKSPSLGIPSWDLRRRVVPSIPSATAVQVPRSRLVASGTLIPRYTQSPFMPPTDKPLDRRRRRLGWECDRQTYARK